MTELVDHADFLAIGTARGFVPSALRQDQAAWIGFIEAKHISMSAYLDARAKTHPHELHREPDEATPELYSLAAQGAHVREHGQGSLKELMETNGMKPGQVRQKPSAEDKLTPTTNPFDDNFRGDKAERIKSMIMGLGAARTHAIATAKGKDISGRPLRPTAFTKRWGS